MQDKYIFVQGLEHVFTLVLRVVRNDMEVKEEVPSRLEPYALGRNGASLSLLPPPGSLLIAFALPGVLGER